MTITSPQNRLVAIACLVLALACFAGVLARLTILLMHAPAVFRAYDVGLGAAAVGALLVSRWVASRTPAARDMSCRHCGKPITTAATETCPACSSTAQFAGAPKNETELMFAAIRGRKLNDLRPAPKKLAR